MPEPEPRIRLGVFARIPGWTARRSPTLRGLAEAFALVAMVLATLWVFKACVGFMS